MPLQHREEGRYTYSHQHGRLDRESWHLGVLQERYWFLGSLDVVVTNPSATNPSEIRYEYRCQIDGVAQVQIGNGSETLKYFHYDHLGSVTAISDASPNINNTQFSDYDAFGRRRHVQHESSAIAAGDYTGVAMSAAELGSKPLHAGVELLKVFKRSEKVADDLSDTGSAVDDLLLTRQQNRSAKQHNESFEPVNFSV